MKYHTWVKYGQTWIQEQVRINRTAVAPTSQIQGVNISWKGLVSMYKCFGDQGPEI